MSDNFAPLLRTRSLVLLWRLGSRVCKLTPSRPLCEEQMRLSLLEELQFAPPAPRLLVFCNSTFPQAQRPMSDASASPHKTVLVVFNNHVLALPKNQIYFILIGHVAATVSHGSGPAKMPNGRHLTNLIDTTSPNAATCKQHHDDSFDSKYVPVDAEISSSPSRCEIESYSQNHALIAAPHGERPTVYLVSSTVRKLAASLTYAP
jgi:hypothetical protein